MSGMRVQYDGKHIYYACSLYTELYETHGWHRVDKEAQTNSGGKRIESLWLSPRTWKALHDIHDDLPLFA